MDAELLGWYASGGEDIQLVQFPSFLYMPQHGPVFETVVAGLRPITPGDDWRTRSLVTALTGVAGIGFVWLCGRELGGYRTGLLAALVLASYPRYVGAIFNNSKDVPLAVGMTAVLWVAIKLFSVWKHGRASDRNTPADPVEGHAAPGGEATAAVASANAASSTTTSTTLVRTQTVGLGR